MMGFTEDSIFILRGTEEGRGWWWGGGVGGGGYLQTQKKIVQEACSECSVFKLRQFARILQLQMMRLRL